MVGYKKRIPERLNLSEVKMGRSSLICDRLPVAVQRFKNNVSLLYLQTIWEFYCLQYITLIKDLDNLNKSLFTRYKAESNIGWP